MSQEDLSFMRDAFEAFASGDMAALAGLLDPEIEWQAAEDPEPKHGFEGVLESLGAWFEIWDEVAIELEELIDGETGIVAVVKEKGRHGGSKREVTERFFQVWRVSDGKIVAFKEYKTKNDALEAAGLRG